MANQTRHKYYAGLNDVNSITSAAGVSLLFFWSKFLVVWVVLSSSPRVLIRDKARQVVASPKIHLTVWSEYKNWWLEGSFIFGSILKNWVPQFFFWDEMMNCFSSAVSNTVVFTENGNPGNKPALAQAYVHTSPHWSCGLSVNLRYNSDSFISPQCWFFFFNILVLNEAKIIILSCFELTML